MRLPLIVLAVLGVPVEALLALGLGALAGRADVHHQLAVGLLGERERARVERVGELLVVLGDHAGAAAAARSSSISSRSSIGATFAIEPCSSGVNPRLTQPGQ